MRFAVIRHPEAGLGTCPETALEHHRGLGWVRVSDWRPSPDEFHLPHFADAHDDLDAPAADIPHADPVDVPDTTDEDEE